MDITLPKIAEGIEECTIVQILVKEGQSVSQGEDLLEVETQKAVAPISAPASGSVAKILVKTGDVVKVGQLLMVLDASGTKEEVSIEDAKAQHDSAGTKQEAEKRPNSTAPFPGRFGGTPPAAPSIRRMAEDLGIDLTRVQGSQRGGRIMLEDIRAYIRSLQALQPDPKTRMPQDDSRFGKSSRQKMSPLRRLVAQRMSESWRSVARVSQFDEADITELMALQKKHSPAYAKKEARLSLLSFAVCASVLSLKEHPRFNASMDEDSEEIILKEFYNVGIAVDTQAGLLVPVIRAADQKSLLDLSLAIDSLAGRARSRKASMDDLTGATFTISNQGSLGGQQFTPMVNPPEVAILGLGRASLQPRVMPSKKGTEIKPRWILPLALSYDHRAVDGGDAVRFLNTFIQALTQFKEEDVRIPSV